MPTENNNQESKLWFSLRGRNALRKQLELLIAHPDAGIDDLRPTLLRPSSAAPEAEQTLLRAAREAADMHEEQLLRSGTGIGD